MLFHSQPVPFPISFLYNILGCKTCFWAVYDSLQNITKTFQSLLNFIYFSKQGE